MKVNTYPKTIILATHNKGKIAEFTALFKAIDMNIQLLSLPQLQLGYAKETGLTFIENALIKARYASKITKTPTLADDSGLIVDYLNGAPGIYSARFAGNKASDLDKINFLLAKLANVPSQYRTAYFYCILVFLRHEQDPVPIISQGYWLGRIAYRPKGNNGFGYDPIFFVDKYQCTSAQLTADVKQKICHRGRALAKLQQQLANLKLINTI